MEALESSQGVASFPGRRDILPSHTTTARVRVMNTIPNQTTPGGHCLPVGESEIVILEKQIPVIMAMVEEDLSLLETAKRSFEAQIDRETAADSDRTFSANDVKAARDKPEADRDAQDLKILEARSASLNTTAHSVAGAFVREHNRGIKPLRSCEIVEQGQPLAEVLSAEKSDSDRMRLVFGDLLEGMVEKLVNERLAKATGSDAAE